MSTLGLNTHMHVNPYTYEFVKDKEEEKGGEEEEEETDEEEKEQQQQLR